MNRAASLLLATTLLVSGCTIRYSHTLAGTIRPITGVPVQNGDTGIEVGLDPVMAEFTFSEPEASHELLAIPCDVGLAQVDYRGHFYEFYLAANFPRVEVTAYCVEE